MDDIPPPLTPDEIRKRDEEAKRKLDEKEQQRAQELKDRSLLETYCSLDEIEAARVRAGVSQQTVVDRANGRKQELANERKRLDDEAEFYTKRDLPEKLKRAFAANNESMKLQQKIIDNAEAEKERVNQGFEEIKKRFRELMAQGMTSCSGRKKK